MDCLVFYLHSIQFHICSLNLNEIQTFKNDSAWIFMPYGNIRQSKYFMTKSQYFSMIQWFSVEHKHKEGLRTLAESLVQMTCSDFTNFSKLTEFTIQDTFSAEMLRFISQLFKKIVKSRFWLACSAENAFYIVNSVNLKKFVKRLQVICTRDSAKVLNPSLCLVPLLRRPGTDWWIQIVLGVFHYPHPLQIWAVDQMAIYQLF